jgi:hypothetical protein
VREATDAADFDEAVVNAVVPNDLFFFHQRLAYDETGDSIPAFERTDEFRQLRKHVQVRRPANPCHRGVLLHLHKPRGLIVMTGGVACTAVGLTTVKTCRRRWSTTPQHG